jgi:hypothetical protein
VTDDLEVPRHVIQHLGHVLAEPGHPFAAVGAGAGTVIARLMHDVLARQMIRQRTALGFGTFTGRGRTIRGFGAGIVFSRAGFQFLEPELELLDLAADPLRRSAKLHPPQLGDLEFQLLDLLRHSAGPDGRHLFSAGRTHGARASDEEDDHAPYRNHSSHRRHHPAIQIPLTLHRPAVKAIGDFYERYSAGTARLLAGFVSCRDRRSTKPPTTSGCNAASSASATCLG